MADPELKFLANEAGEKEGLGDAGIEMFQGTPYVSCAREAGQNSRDAATGLPAHAVTMSFNVFEIDHANLPFHGALREAIDACQAEANQDREMEFFKNASKVIRTNPILVLEIADHNTKGLVGPPDEDETPFHSLVKGSGVTAKDRVDSGGSFGIGKNASFAVSDLRTVFYTTTYEDEGGKAFAAQGKVKLVSHNSRDGTKRRATGYWGLPDGFRAVTDRNSVPVWMTERSEIGTSIFCIGFRAADDWAERMAYSLVSNFFCAVLRKQMVFEVDNKNICINHNTIEKLFTQQYIADAAERTGHEADLKFAEQLYRCLVSGKAEEKLLKVPQLGKIKVRVLIEEGMPRRVGFIRNGMLITDNLQHFGHPLRQFRGSSDFIAVVEPVDEEAGALLKSIENPAHDSFSAEQLPDDDKRAVADKAMRCLGKELREIIKEAAGVKREGAVSLNEMNRFFFDPRSADPTGTPDAEHDPERYEYESTRRNRKLSSVPDNKAEGNRGGSSRTGTGSGGTGGGRGSGTGSGEGGQGTGGERKPVALLDTRNLIRLDESGKATYRELHFTPQAAGLIDVTVQATGVNVPEGLYVRHADVGTPNSGTLTLSVKKDERFKVTVSFDEPYDGPIELRAISRADPTGTST